MIYPHITLALICSQVTNSILHVFGRLKTKKFGSRTAAERLNTHPLNTRTHLTVPGFSIFLLLLPLALGRPFVYGWHLAVMLAKQSENSRKGCEGVGRKLNGKRTVAVRRPSANGRRTDYRNNLSP